MKKKKKQIRVPAAKFGLEQIGNIAEQLPNAAQLLSSPFQKSTAISNGEAVAQSVSGIMSGAATGAQIGSIAGPIGSAIGAIGGAAVGLVGKKGEEAEMTSFTDYDEGTLGTGLIGAFSNKKLRRRRERIKKNAYNNRAAVQGTEQLASDYDMEYGDLDTNTFNLGGTTDSSLVYVDDGELLRTPDGSIHEVAEQGKPTDSNLLNLPNGSRILSDSLKVPGTSETFANAGKRIMKNKKSMYNDKYSENAQRLNDINNQLAYDKLFALQESVKKQKGIKPKTKNLVQAAENGDEVGNNNQDRKKFSGRRSFNVKGNTYSIIDPTQKIVKYDEPIGPEEFEYEYPNYFAGEWSDENTVDFLNKDTKNNLFYSNYKYPLFPSNKNLNNWGFNEGWSKGLTNTSSTFVDPVQTSSGRKKRTTPSSNQQTVTSGSDYDWKEEDPLNPRWYMDKPIEMAPILDQQDETVPDVEATPNDIKTQKSDNSKSWDKIINGLTGLAEIAPALSNIFASKDKPVQANYNPYSNAVLKAARGRRYDINPYLRDIERNRAISNYNASQMNTNTGASMAFRLANAVNTDRASADVRAQQSNMNNQYIGEYVNIANNLGQQWVGATNLAEDMNRKQIANTRNIRRTGMSQLSQWAQNKQLMRNQMNRDNAMLALYGPYLEGVFTRNTMDDYRKWLQKGGNSWG